MRLPWVQLPLWIKIHIELLRQVPVSNLGRHGAPGSVGDGATGRLEFTMAYVGARRLSTG